MIWKNFKKTGVPSLKLSVWLVLTSRIKFTTVYIQCIPKNVCHLYFTYSDAAVTNKAKKLHNMNDQESSYFPGTEVRSEKITGSNNTSFKESELMLFVASRKSFVQAS